VANDTIWLAIACVLSKVNISSLPNENVEDYFSDGHFWYALISGAYAEI
jgi:hypothetical protein